MSTRGKDGKGESPKADDNQLNLIAPHHGCFYQPVSGKSGLGQRRGIELAQRVYDRPNSEDATFAITMTLTEKGHSPRVRKLILYRLDKKAGEVSTLIRFTEPADIEGTGLLTQDRAGSDSNQWIYLPALKWVRRIDSNRKGGRFVNSDYYYEDLRDRQVARTTSMALRTSGMQAKLI